MAKSYTNSFSAFLILLFSVAHSQSSCPLGSFSRAGECVKCPAGTFQNEAGAISCKPCPAGHYSPISGIQGIDLCRPCPSGTFSPSTGATSLEACKKCPSGTNAQAGAPKCISCPPGTAIINCEIQSSTGAPFRDLRGTCFDCIFGNLLTVCSPIGPVDPICNVCGENFFPPFSGPNALKCENCPIGTFFDERTKECKAGPTNCRAGNGLVAGRCQRCSLFQFNDGTFEECRTCPEGSQGNARSGSTKCVPCPSGTAKRGIQSLECFRCERGQNSFVTGARYCFNETLKECPPGFSKGKGGACLRCTVFERFDREMKACVKCPENSLSEGGLSTTCERCGRGMITDPLYERCLCMPGWGFVLGSNGSKCEKCPPGTANNDPLGTCRRCLSCPGEKEQQTVGETEQVKKTECGTGLFNREFVGCVEEETNCPLSHRRIERIGFLPRCEPLSADVCPTGTVLAFLNDARIAKACGTCSSGRRYDPVTMTCEPCAENEFNPSGVSTQCERCKNGTIPFDGECRCSSGRRIVDGRCVECPKGTFGLVRVDGCRPCPAGTFSDGRLLERCLTCRAGTFTDQSGQGRCKRCPKGMTSFGFGETGCVPLSNVSP